MRKIVILLLIAIWYSGCTSSEKLLEKGNYDEAIEKSSKKLRKKPNDVKELNVLKEAYSKANQFSLERIAFLEKENRAENWIEIYELYTDLNYRQHYIKALPSTLISEFNIVDYDSKIIHSKNNAAEILYQNGVDNLNRVDRESARIAYHEFERIRQLYTRYKDVEDKIEEARYMGTNNVLFVIENNSDVILPEDFDYELKKISLKELNRQWLNYDTFADSTKKYDYMIALDIDKIELSPERIESKTFIESKEIEDGTQYVFDENGNVQKDSLGNDIKVPQVKKVSADVIESIQYKSARVAGAIDYIDLRTDQLVKTEEIIVDAIFEHHSAVASGDKEALSEESLKIVNNKPVLFPSNEDLLMDAAHLLKEKTKIIVMHNRNLLKY